MARKVSGIEVSELPKLCSSELESMLREIKKGNKELREIFLLSNARLVLVAVQKFRSAKESADDLFQVGMLGLMKATDNFDVTLNLKFSTYAVPMIYGEIRRYIRENTAFKVGRQVRDVYDSWIAEVRICGYCGRVGVTILRSSKRVGRVSGTAIYL